MKRIFAIALVASVGLFAGSAYAAPALSGTISAAPGAVAGYSNGLTANGIAASKHNLGSLGAAITVTPDNANVGAHTEANMTGAVPNPGSEGTRGTSEVCAFCHTPHHANQDVLTGGAAPLWNRVGATTSWTAYGTTTAGVNGTTLGGNATTVAGISLACLSCHDGVTAMDNLVNAPGPRGVNPLGLNVGDLTPLYMWQDATGPAGGINAQQMGGEAFLNIGNNGGDLSNDHPIGITYGGATPNAPTVASLRPANTAFSAINLEAGLAFTATTLSTQLQANLQQNRWAIKGYITDAALISDTLRGGKVECVSCHDPHFKNLSNIDLDFTTGALYTALPERPQVTYAGNQVGGYAADGLFLRRVGGNAGSGVCRTCHNK